MGIRPQVRLQPSLPNRRLRAVFRSASLSSERKAQPFSLNEPPKPSQVWATDVSLTVTSAVPLVASVRVPLVVQYAPAVDVTKGGCTKLLPAEPAEPAEPA